MFNKKQIPLRAFIAAACLSSAAGLQAQEITGYSMNVPTGDSQLSFYDGIEPLYGNWLTVGLHYNCAAWSPELLAVDYGQTFLQYRICSQDFERSVTNREKDSFSGEIRDVSTGTDQKTEQESEAQNATGTYQNWQPMTSGASSWTDTGTAYGHTDWDPAAATQTADFIQSLSYQQNQTRTMQDKEYDTITGDIRNVGDAYTETRTLTHPQSRTIAVSVDDYLDSGELQNCSAWSPATSTVLFDQTFTQTRSCSQGQVRTWTYQAGSTTIHSWEESTTEPVNESRSATGTMADCRYEGYYGGFYGGAQSYTQIDPDPTVTLGSAFYWAGRTVLGQPKLPRTLPKGESNAVRSDYDGYLYWAGTYQEGREVNSSVDSEYYSVCRKL